MVWFLFGTTEDTKYRLNNLKVPLHFSSLLLFPTLFLI